MAILNFSKTFTGGGILNTIKSFLPVSCGVPESALSTISTAKHSVIIYATREGEDKPRIKIIGWLQEKFELEVSSDWGLIQDMGKGLNDILDTGVQFLSAGKGSLHSTIATRRKWKGSQPIELKVKLRFEAIDNVKKEVLEPCYNLKALCLPSGGLGDAQEQWFVNPPGPNPFYIKNAAANFTVPNTNMQPFGPGEKISISIGGFGKDSDQSTATPAFLSFNNVIVKNVRVVFENRMSSKGPVGATVDVVFQTYEMLTRESLATCYGQQAISFDKI